MPENEAYEFLMNEYYIALGQEDAKSKFFPLFSIIEYIEHRYEQYNGAETALRPGVRSACQGSEYRTGGQA